MVTFKKTTRSIPKYDAKGHAKKKEVKEADKKQKDALVVASKVESLQSEGRGLDIAQVLLRPHVTEKASDLSEKGVYAFDINTRANKMHVRQAVEKFYKVKPVKVAIQITKPKYMKNPRSNRIQTKKALNKKALVYLKAGDKIEFA